jgi:hypothetical protein
MPRPPTRKTIPLVHYKHLKIDTLHTLLHMKIEKKSWVFIAIHDIMLQSKGGELSGLDLQSKPTHLMRKGYTL